MHPNVSETFFLRCFFFSTLTRQPWRQRGSKLENQKTLRTEVRPRQEAENVQLSSRTSQRSHPLPINGVVVFGGLEALPSPFSLSLCSTRISTLSPRRHIIPLEVYIFAGTLLVAASLHPCVSLPPSSSCSLEFGQFPLTIFHPPCRTTANSSPLTVFDSRLFRGWQCGWCLVVSGPQCVTWVAFFDAFQGWKGRKASTCWLSDDSDSVNVDFQGFEIGNRRSTFMHEFDERDFADRSDIWWISGDQLAVWIWWVADMILSLGQRILWEIGDGDWRRILRQ